MPQPAIAVKSRGPRSLAGFNGYPQFMPMDTLMPRMIRPMARGSTPLGAPIFLLSVMARMHSTSMPVPITCSRKPHWSFNLLHLLSNMKLIWFANMHLDAGPGSPRDSSHPSLPLSMAQIRQKLQEHHGYYNAQLREELRFLRLQDSRCRTCRQNSTVYCLSSIQTEHSYLSTSLSLISLPLSHLYSV